MTGCPTLDELVGGYVLGALEQAEMDQMRRHIAECPRCGREVHGLAPARARLAAALDDAQANHAAGRAVLCASA